MFFNHGKILKKQLAFLGGPDGDPPLIYDDKRLNDSSFNFPVYRCNKSFKILASTSGEQIIQAHIMKLTQKLFKNRGRIPEIAQTQIGITLLGYCSWNLNKNLYGLRFNIYFALFRCFGYLM
ncbi:hypothetical protein HZS_5976 [Henneguya salminicola]|nr:hypothetical protein HZS_5976 [Henneguya salminicola]